MKSVRRLVLHVIGFLLLVAQASIASAKENVFVFPSQKYPDAFLMTSETLPQFASVARTIDPDLVITARDCGVINSWYRSQEKEITLCYEYLNDAYSFIEARYRNAPPTTQMLLKLGTFAGVLVHELGHAVIHTHDLPIIGGEEDAADRIATIMFLEFAEKKPAEGKVMLVGDLAYKWDRRFNALDKLINARNLYANEHPLNEQRVFNIVCLAYGSNPALFLDTAQQLKLPRERAMRCQHEYFETKKAVDQFLN
jgi:hypothetical protein